MQISFDSDQRLLILAFEAREQVEPFVASMREQSGFLAAVSARLERGSEVTVELAAPDGFELRLGARALHVFHEGPDGFTTAFETAAWTTAKELELRRKLETRGGAEADDADRSESLGASPIFRIQKMTPPEKARLALKANRTERQILLRETSPQVMMALLANPHLESDDVLQMVRSPYAPGSVLKRIASDRRWSSSIEVRSAIVRNPQTPSPLAKSLLPALPTSVLQGLARGADAREDLKKAALKLYLARLGK